MQTERTVLFLHGIGAGPSSWNVQISRLPVGFTGWAPTIPGMSEAATRGFSWSSAAAGLVAEMDRRGIDRVDVCGLSLGAMVATQLAIDAPQRVRTLVLSGSQVRPNPVLMRLQIGISRLLPERIVPRGEISKPAMVAILEAVAAIDFRADLAGIVAPTLVLCGSRDPANLPAARQLAAEIPDARLQVIHGGGHAVNTQLPARFAEILHAFYT